MSERRMNTPQPIRRHAALVHLSREHHFGLLLVWKIRVGIRMKVDPERISDYVQYYFMQDIFTHFRIEEQDIFSLLPDDDDLRIRAEHEHARMRALIDELQREPELPTLVRIADALEEHIRFEERILFNHIQEFLTDRISVPPEREPHPDPDLEWPDHFWASDRDIQSPPK